MQTEAKDLATDNWPLILSKAGIDDDFLVNKHGPCPVCGGTDRFRFDNKNGSGSFFCSTCRAGDGFKLLMLYKGISFKDAAQFVREVMGGCSVEKTIRPKRDVAADDAVKREATKAKLQKTWDIAKQVKKGDSVWKYLALISGGGFVCLRYQCYGGCNYPGWVLEFHQSVPGGFNLLSTTTASLGLFANVCIPN